MKIFIILLMCAFILIGCGNKSNEQKQVKGKMVVTDKESSTSEIAQNVTPAIVGVLATNENGDSVGAGVCVNEDGYVVTNYHVIAGSDNIVLYLSDGSTTGAELKYKDSNMDIAILKANTSLPYLKIAEDDVMVGEDVLAVGTPISLLLQHSFTKGIVSAVNRTLKVSTSSGEAYMQNLIQHDASLNSGNSGGPLINEKGEIIGINTLKISGGEGIGFAIPVKTFNTLLNNIITDINYVAPYVGLFGYDAEIAYFSKQTNEKDGVYVLELAEDSPLKKADARSGDVITSVNGVKVKTITDFRNELYRQTSGESINVELLRDGKLYSADIVLEKHPVNNVTNVKR